MQRCVLTRPPVKIPCDSIAGLRPTGSFDWVVDRYENDHFAQDDKVQVECP